MPYIKSEYREPIKKNIALVDNPGKLNYLITLWILKAWNENPRYEMIHSLRKECVVDPKHSKFINHLRDIFADRFTTADVYTAAQEAFYEFRFRVGTLYEALKCAENGDLSQYREILDELQQNLFSTIKDHKSKEIIIPGGK